jgi:hypothetical protein
MENLPLVLLQYGLSFVFVWTGILIFKDTPGWATMIEKSWVRNLLPFSPQTEMRVIAVFDLVVGAWLAVGISLWIPAALAALHLLSVLLAKGIMGPTYRDVGLLAMAVALALMTAPIV